MADLVYCTKCGAENEEDAVNCASCGEPLKEKPRYRRVRRRRDDNLCFGSGGRRDDDLCFGSGGGSKIGIFIGLMIVLAGLSQLLERSFAWASMDRLWPIPVILLGLYIVYNALSKR